MITAYAILATFFLGAFVRHNFNEMRTSFKTYRNYKKLEREIARAKKERQAEEAKTPVIPEQR